MRSKSMAAESTGRVTPVVLYDRYLLLASIGLVAIGLLMVYSSSIVISDRIYGQPFHYFARQGVYLLFGVILGLFVVRINLEWWRSVGGFLLLVTLILLALVLVPGIGRQVNGSMRWVGFRVIGLQVSEVAKLTLVVYMAGYLVRHRQEVRTQISGFMKPMVLLGLIMLLLLREPDFGAAAVIMFTALGMMFLAGVRLWQFGVLLTLVVVGLGTLAVSSPYRMARLTSFLNPWANQFDTGYQLTQSLIAFGRGGWLGVGLGESVQKLLYLPEAHTDFLFAVLAEELGLFGALFVILLFIVVVGRALQIGRVAQQQGRYFASYMAYGFALWIGLQAMINMGVNAGVLPTKGLTLPLMSYGGSSVLVICVAVALLLRIDYESRMVSFGLQSPADRLRALKLRYSR